MRIRDDLLPDLTLAFNETFQMLSISTVLAILEWSTARFSDFVTDRHLFWQNRFIYLVARPAEYYPLGAICYFTGAVTAANAAFAALPAHWPDCSLRPAVGGRYRVLCTPVDMRP